MRAPRAGRAEHQSQPGSPGTHGENVTAAGAHQPARQAGGTATRSGPRWCTTWLAVGGCRRSSARRRPPRSIAGSCSRRHLRQCTAGPRPSLSAPRVSPRWRRARCPPPRPADPPGARYLAELGRRRGDFGLGWLTPAGMPPGYAFQAGNEQTIRGGSGAIRAIRPESNMYPIKASWLGWSFARRPAGGTGGRGSHARVAGQSAATGGIWSPTSRPGAIRPAPPGR